MTQPLPTNLLPAPQVTGGYITLPVTVDPATILANAEAFLAANLPGYVARPGHLESWLLEAMAQMVAETAQVAAIVPLSIFQYFGQSLLGLPANAGAAASMGSTWTLTDTAGHTIPAGTVVAYSLAGQSGVLFATQSAVTVPAPGTGLLAAPAAFTAGATAATGGTFAGGPNLTTPTGVTATGSATGGTLAAASYFYRVSAVNAQGETLASTEVTSGALTGTTSSVALSWTAVPGATGYRVYRTTTSGTYTSPAFLSAPTGTTYTDTGGTALTAGTVTTANTATTSAPYFWKVTALSAYGETLGSNEVTANVLPNGTQALSWTAVPGATGYKVYRGTAAGAENALITTTTSVAYTDTGTSGSAATLPTANTTGSPATTQTAPGQVILVAQQVGDGNNGLPPGPITLVDNLAFVSSIVSTAVSTGGVAAETQAAYLSRLSGDLALLAPRPIIPSDFSALARNQPSVARATTLDGYNPAGGTSNNSRMVTVACVDTAGNALSAGAQGAVSAALQAQREVNFVVNVVGPSYTSVDVSAQIVATRGANINTVQAAADAALAAFLNPATWGGPPPAWMNNTTVRYLSVAGLLADLPGVGYIQGIQLAVTGNTMLAQDVQLVGAIPLPRPGNISVNVTAGT